MNKGIDSKNYNLKDRIFSFLEILINSIKYQGVFKGFIISFHYVQCRFFSKYLKGNIYTFLKLKLAYADVQSVINTLFELFGENVYFFKTESLNPIIIDIGANIGDSLIYFKFLYPNCRVYAFEPHPDAYNLLQRNIELNNFKDVHTYNEALGEKEGFLKLYIDTQNVFNASTTSKELSIMQFGKKAKELQIKINKISNNPDIRKLGQIDLLKIDIEGAESKLFEDLEDILPKTNKVILEFHLVPNIKENSFDSIISILRKAGLHPSITGFYRDTLNSTNQLDFLITADR